MACGCKNKQPQQPAPSTSTPVTQTTNQTNNSIQESIKKVVEKYYTKK
jgi:hypothetical protein